MQLTSFAVCHRHKDACGGQGESDRKGRELISNLKLPCASCKKTHRVQADSLRQESHTYRECGRSRVLAEVNTPEMLLYIKR
jgi:hypothetical protein